MLAHPQGSIIRRAGYKQFDDNSEPVTGMAEREAPPFRIPPRTAVRTNHALMIVVVLTSRWLFNI